MGKSPGMWAKSVHFGKRSSKSNLSKDDATSNKNTLFTITSQSNSFNADSTCISSPACHVITQLQKSFSSNSLHDNNNNNASNDDELDLEQAATMLQAAFRGYLDRRVFWVLQGVIRIQAVIRGQLVRRRTLYSMCAIVELQAVVRGQIVRLSERFPQMVQKRTLQEHVALGKGLEGSFLKTEDIEAVSELKECLDKSNKEVNLLGLTKARVTRVQTSGTGDRVCVDLCSLMRLGEGLLVGSYARGLFLVHSECLQSNYIASWHFRVNAGPVHAYVAVPGGKTCYLSELKAGKEVIVVDQSGIQRTAVVGRVKIETRPLIILDAKIDSDEETCYSIILESSETVGLVPPIKGGGNEARVIPVTSLKVGDEVVVRVQSGVRHNGIQIQEFILEK